MFGVVLWSDRSDRKAVIWCEDHGELAYFSASDGASDPGLHEDVCLDPGDLVQFDLTESRAMRRAVNPRIVAEEQYPSLASRLQQAKCMASEPVNIPPVTREEGDTSAIILPFARRRRGPAVAARRGTA